MSHKDRFTGVEVADMYEIMSPEDWENVWQALDDDTRLMEKELREEWYERVMAHIREYGEDYMDEMVALMPASKSPTALIGVGATIGFGGSSTYIDYYGSDGRKYRFYTSETSGSYCEPPDYYEEILDLEEVRRSEL